MEVLAMKKKPSKPKPVAGERFLVTVACGQEWKDWIERASAHSSLNVSTFIALAAKKFAETNGFDEPMPPRSP
jgi:hypothetical protein